VRNPSSNDSPRNPAKEHAGRTRRRKGLDREADRDLKVRPAEEEPEERTSRPESTAPKEDRAVLIGVGTEAYAADEAAAALDELAELVRAAGARTVARLYQRREAAAGSSYLGKGKLGELGEMVERVEANLVVADDDLSPSQVRHLEEAAKCRVIDRSELIIDIFAKRARTEQAKLQVALAQLQYQMPRLKRMWTHLSRITGAGGVGSRGPGEKQIEVDRRLAKARVDELRAQLAKIEERRDRVVKSRAATFNVALVGYTNVGKSTLMNRLTGADVFVADMLFATLDPRTRHWDLGDGIKVLLSDTVGFVEKLPHHLVASFHATLAEVTGADLLLHAVDASDPALEAKMECVRAVLKDIGAGEIPEIVLLNKADRVTDPAALAAVRARLGEHFVVSALHGQGLEELGRRVRRAASAFESVVELAIPASDGRTLARLAATAAIFSRDYVDDVCRIRASVPRAELHHFERYVVPTPES
jgi:GTP-binding protein HflX